MFFVSLGIIEASPIVDDVQRVKCHSVKDDHDNSSICNSIQVGHFLFFLSFSLMGMNFFLKAFFLLVFFPAARLAR